MAFFRSTSGRLLALSIAVSFVCGGVSALMPRGVESTLLESAALFLPVVINAFGLPQALEDDWEHAVIAIVSLPPQFFLWAVGLGSIREFHPWLGYPFIILGLGALAVAVLPSHHAPSHRLIHVEQH